jgi:hypothetical protein
MKTANSWPSARILRISRGLILAALFLSPLVSHANYDTTDWPEKLPTEMLAMQWANEAACLNNELQSMETSDGLNILSAATELDNKRNDLLARLTKVQNRQSPQTELLATPLQTIIQWIPCLRFMCGCVSNDTPLMEAITMLQRASLASTVNTDKCKTDVNQELREANGLCRHLLRYPEIGEDADRIAGLLEKTLDETEMGECYIIRPTTPVSPRALGEKMVAHHRIRGGSEATRQNRAKAAHTGLWCKPLKVDFGMEVLS